MIAVFLWYNRIELCGLKPFVERVVLTKGPHSINHIVSRELFFIVRMKVHAKNNRLCSCI